LDFDISFHKDINFLVGLNGCGKTTVLKLINAILLPDIKELARLPFQECEIEFSVAKIKGTVSILVTQKDGVLEYIPSFSEESYKENISEILDDDYEIPKLVERFKRVANPVLVSIDRKFENNLRSNRDLRTIFWEQENQTKEVDPLLDVKRLIKKEARSIEMKDNREDTQLKDKILIDAFNIIELTEQNSFESDIDGSLLDSKRDLITNVLGSLSLNNKNLENVLNATEIYFYELKKNINEISKYSDVEESARLSNKDYMNAITFLFMNRPQITRIDKMVKFITDSQAKKARFRERFILFKEIVNSFFEQTGKEILIESGNLKIEIAGTKVEVKSLSSGESQIITLLAQILFNRRLVSKAALLIDEPELSLHLAWQEMFVESLQKANSNIQVILATHSPAIIKGQDHKCVFVNSNQASKGLDSLL
jgi:predicted ATP-binding protein involved in virulence